jgi:hypothetical protein
MNALDRIEVAAEKAWCCAEVELELLLVSKEPRRVAVGLQGFARHEDGEPMMLGSHTQCDDESEEQFLERVARLYEAPDGP